MKNVLKRLNDSDLKILQMNITGASFTDICTEIKGVKPNPRAVGQNLLHRASTHLYGKIASSPDFHLAKLINNEIKRRKL